MAYLIGVLAPGLLIAAALGAVAGWNIYGHLHKPRLEKLAERRRQARNALIRLASGQPRPAAARDGLEAELARLRHALAERQSELTEARSEVIRLNARMGARDPELVAAQKETHRLAGEVTRLTEALAAFEQDRAKAAAEAKQRQWRAQYLDARVRFLEGRLAQQPQPADSTDLKARIAELEAALADLAGEADERNRLRWQNRYLAARVRHLEENAIAAAPIPAPPASEPPAEDPQDLARRRWRLAYFEARAKHLEDQLRASPPAPQEDPRVAALEAEGAALRAEIDALAARAAEVDTLKAHLAQAQQQMNGLLEEAAGLDQALSAAKARTAELEAEAAKRPEEGDLQRLRWRARYLALRVQDLERRLADARPQPQPETQPQPQPQAQPEPPPPQPRPLALERRPQGVAAPRGGLADDLTLITGVAPKIERTLNSLGIYHYEQIAGWSDENVAWIDRFLSFKGRIARERWVEQAAALARGEAALTPARRYLDGEIY